MNELKLDFVKKTFSIYPQYYFTNYNSSASGWKNGIFHSKLPTIKINPSVSLSSYGLKVLTQAWDETGKPINGDDKSRAHCTYADTLHIVLKVKNANYKLSLLLINKQDQKQIIDILVNKVVVTTVEILANSQLNLVKEIALTKDIFDLSFVEHIRSNTREAAKANTVYLVELKLKRTYKKKGKTLGIYIVSDSTAQTYSAQEYPQSGWGAELYHQIKGNDVKVSASSFYPQATKYLLNNLFIDNRSIGARSSKTFITEGRLEAILKDIKPGDWALIQFGDNDATAYRPDRYVSPENFSIYLNQYVDSVRARGAHPILISPPTQFKYDDKSRQFKICFNDYRRQMFTLSQKKNIPFIDLGKETTNLLNKWGKDPAHALFLQVQKLDYPNLKEDKFDITHFQEYGAFEVAKIVAKNMMKIMNKKIFELRQYHQDYRPIIDYRLQKTFLKWHEISESEFYIIKYIDQKERKHYLTTTTLNRVCISGVARRKYLILPYKEGLRLKNKIVIDCNEISEA